MRRALCVSISVVSLWGSSKVLAQQASQSNHQTATANALSIAGSGTTGFVPLWTNSTTLGNSTIFQSTTNVGVGTQSPAAKLDVNGTAKFRGVVTFASGQTFPGAAGLGANTFGASQVIQTGHLSINNGGIYLPQTTNANVGVVDIGGSPFIHACCPKSTENTFVGMNAGNFSASSADTGGFGDNTGVGYFALFSLSSGYGNTAIGTSAMLGNTSGLENTAIGDSALSQNTTGFQNTAIGNSTMTGNKTGQENTAIGFSALESVSGNTNVALGSGAGSFLQTGSSNILVGTNSGVGLSSNESNNIDIGNSGVAGDSRVIRIGSSDQSTIYVSGIRGVKTGLSDAVAVMIDSNGQLGTVLSALRYKDEIHDMGDASAGLLSLRPVTFRYKDPYAEGFKKVQYGLIAEEVAEVYPDLVVRGKDGNVETVQYWKLDSMLLNELQKLAKAHTADKDRIEKLEAETKTLQLQIAEQQKLILSQAQIRETEREELAQLRAEIKRLAFAVGTDKRSIISAVASTDSQSLHRISNQ